MKIKNKERLMKALEAIKDILLVEYGEEISPKYINIELFRGEEGNNTAPVSIATKRSVKYGREFFSISARVAMNNDIVLSRLIRDGGAS